VKVTPEEVLAYRLMMLVAQEKCSHRRPLIKWLGFCRCRSAKIKHRLLDGRELEMCLLCGKSEVVV